MHVRVFICVFVCFCICPSAHMEVKEPIVGVCSLLLPCGLCESNPGCQTWWQVPLHDESSYHTLNCTLSEKKNTDAINWILQFILKLNFYILTNAKCQLYSIINDSFLTLKFLRASLIYFPLVAMIDPITVYVSLSFWTHNYWSFIVCDLSRLASFTSWVDGG